MGQESARRIYVIDDDPPILRAIERTLRRAGVEILTFQAPRAALQSMVAQPPSVVLTDYNMPELNGGDVLRRVAELYPSALRILLTANASFLAIEDRAAAQVVLGKPWTIDELKRSIDFP